MFKLLEFFVLLLASVSFSHAMQSCKEMKGKTYRSGVYNLNTTDGFEYQTFCDMITDGGGWTLVASIHENNAHDNGRCTVGDKWSSEQGNNQNTKHGDGNWENLKTFGNVASATSDDFKSLAYFSIDDAKDVMIWQVPNNTPLSMWRSNSYLRYRTYSQFLSGLGGNLQNLFQSYYPIRQGVYSPGSDSGPSFPVKYDEGSPADTLTHFGTDIQAYLTAGYIQLRTVNHAQHINAMCLGVKVDASGKEHYANACIGGSSFWGGESNCGDSSGMTQDGYGTGTGRSVDKTLIETTFLIFYR